MRAILRTPVISRQILAARATDPSLFIWSRISPPSPSTGMDFPSSSTWRLKVTKTLFWRRITSNVLLLTGTVSSIMRTPSGFRGGLDQSPFTQEPGGAIQVLILFQCRIVGIEIDLPVQVQRPAGRADPHGEA